MDVAVLMKSNKWIYSLYYYTMSYTFRLIGLFLKIDNRLILFTSFGGRYYNDSPRCIFEAMLRDERFKDYKLVWAFKHPKKHDIPTLKVNISSLKFFITALKARCWITNVSMERGLNFKKKGTFYFHTTHTTLPKVIGYDIEIKNFRHFKYSFDCSCAQSPKEKEMQKSMFHLRSDQILVSGYPKNDELCHYSREKWLHIREKLNLPIGKKVILYAPTFRNPNQSSMKSPVDFKKWESILGSGYVVLFRAHPVVASETEIDSSSGFIYDFSGYPNNVDLMIAADILISDYSGIFFEFAVQKKPMFIYAYDYEDYVKTRSLYFDLRNLLPGGFMDDVELLKTIKNDNFQMYEALWKSFRNDYVSEYGHATEQCVERIYKELM